MKEKFVAAKGGVAINVLGDNQLIKLTSEESNGSLAVIMQQLPPGLEVPTHIHSNEDEHFHLLEGQLSFNVEDKTYELNAGDMIFLPRNIPHSIKVVGTNTAIVRLSIAPAGLEKMFVELDQLSGDSLNNENIAAVCGQYGVRFV